MKRVLVLRGGAIGDFVLTLPIFNAVRLFAPEAEVEVLGYPEIAELAVGRRYALGVRRVAGAEWAPLFSPGGALGTREREYVSGFDCVISVWPDADGVILDNFKRAGAREVIAIEPMPPEDASVHAVEYMVKQCERAGLPVKFLEPQLFPSERDRLWAERFMRVTCAGEMPLLGMHVGSGSAKKNWPAERYAEVAEWWIGRGRGHVLVTAGPADDDALGAFRGARGDERVFVLRGESLPRVAACLERCEAVVGNDSGIVHLAAAVCVPTLTLFGPTDARVWRPCSSRGEVMSSAAGRGMEGIMPGAVIECLDSILQRA